MIGAATGQTNAWASAMSGVRAEINAILSSLSAIGGGVISNAGKRAEVTALQAGQTVRQAEVARLRFENEQKMTAKEMGAGSGVSGWAQRQLINMERFQFDEGIRLDDQLNSQREAARKRETSSAGGGGGGGGGGGRTAALTEEQKATEDLTKSLIERLSSLESERIALGLVASGQFATAEAASLMADAMVKGGGMVDGQTEAMIRQIDAAAKLNEELRKVATDPVREWMKSVPNWIQAGQQIEMGAIGSLKTAISDFIKTGKFDLESLGESILGVVADIVADKAVAELANLLGRGKEGAGGLGGLLGGLLSSAGDAPTGDAAGVAQGGVQAGAAISNAMITAGQQVSAQLANAMTTGGVQVGQSAQQGLAIGSNTVRTAGQQGLAIGANNVRIAGSTSGQLMAQGVVSGARQGAPILAQGVASGAAGGGPLASVGGLGGILGMILPGIFHDGGVVGSATSTRPVPASLFHGAPRYHDGGPVLARDEVPAILQTGEYVLPRGSWGVGGGEKSSAGNTVINQSFTFPNADIDSFRRSRGQLATDAARAGQAALGRNG